MVITQSELSELFVEDGGEEEGAEKPGFYLSEGGDPYQARARQFVLFEHAENCIFLILY